MWGTIETKKIDAREKSSREAHSEKHNTETTFWAGNTHSMCYYIDWTANKKHYYLRQCENNFLFERLKDI